MAIPAGYWAPLRAPALWPTALGAALGALPVHPWDQNWTSTTAVQMLS